MDLETARALLAGSEDEDERIHLPLSVLEKLSVDDMKEGSLVGVGIEREQFIHLDWEGHLYRSGRKVMAEAEYSWPRKYWTGPIGLQEYLDLIRRAIEVRSQTIGDVQLLNYEDDDTWIHLSFSIFTDETNLRTAFERARKIRNELEESADRTCDEVGQRIAEIAARVSGWGSQSLDALVHAVEKATGADAKGRSLEELCSRLFESVQGLTVTGRVRTATEEIDISILNDSRDARMRREAAIILAECKNWTGKCGKDEFVVFREKLENRNRRSTLGILISWNGFTSTVTKEMLRGSREDIVVVPITGQEIRAAVMEGNFEKVLMKCWDDAVHL